MNPIIQNLVNSVVNAAGNSAAQSPQVQQAVTALQDELNKVNKLVLGATIAGGLIFVFYYLPRFEVPGKRWNRRYA